MSDQLAGLYNTPAGDVWRQFAALCAIPRPSKQEDRVRQQLLGVGRANGWDCRQDAAGNVLLAVPGCGAMAGAEPLVLQAHMDMVCEKNSDVEHDFDADPIRPRIAGEWVVADGTTLGADNGIGIAPALAVAEAPAASRAPLDLLFTVDEETGLNGAIALDPAIVRGRCLLNLDSGEDDVFIIGCAGGVELRVDIPLEPAATRAGIECRLTGLRGGHSGTEINEDRENAIRIAATALAQLREANPELQLRELAGGNKTNAIPRECRFVVTGADEAAARQVLDQVLATTCSQEPAARWEIAAAPPSAPGIVPWAMVELLLAAPNGVLAMDSHYDGLVQTSNNIGVVQTGANAATFVMFGRSSTVAGLEGLKTRVAALAAKTDGAFTGTDEFHGWSPNPDSALLRMCQAVHRDLFGHEAEVTCIHAGLETGIIGGKIGSTELLSCGPTTVNMHSPDERLRIDSVERSRRFLEALVGRWGQDA